MQIDFSPLNTIRTQTEPRANQEKNAFSADSVLKTEQQERQQMQAVYRTYQMNTRKAEKLKIDILKDLKSGMPAGELLLTAVQCISLLTADAAFYEEVAADMNILQGTFAYTPQEKEHRLQLMKRCIDEKLKEFQQK